MCTIIECVQLVDNVMSRLKTQQKVLLWDPSGHCLRVLGVKSRAVEELWGTERQRRVVGIFDSRANFLDIVYALQATLEDVGRRRSAG